MPDFGARAGRVRSCVNQQGRDSPERYLPICQPGQDKRGLTPPPRQPRPTARGPTACERVNLRGGRQPTAEAAPYVGRLMASGESHARPWGLVLAACDPAMLSQQS